jgi:hypothetical protein
LINAPNKVLIWQSQLTANDFPPVCAMTGATAETWRKFTFSKTPAWSYLGGLLVAAALAQRVSGYLPLTRASAKRQRLASLTFRALFPVGLSLWLVGAIVEVSVSNTAVAGPVFGFLLLLGFAFFAAAVVAGLFGKRALGPKGKILTRQPGHYESLIELRDLHPLFVNAVQQHQQARAAQFAPPSPCP